jgi:hypothetical protein
MKSLIMSLILIGGITISGLAQVSPGVGTPQTSPGNVTPDAQNPYGTVTPTQPYGSGTVTPNDGMGNVNPGTSSGTVNPSDANPSPDIQNCPYGVVCSNMPVSTPNTYEEGNLPDENRNVAPTVPYGNDNNEFGNGSQSDQGLNQPVSPYGSGTGTMGNSGGTLDSY